MGKIRSYKDLRIYQASMDPAMAIFELTRDFPFEERYSLVDQIRRLSRSVCANIGEAWRKRRYPKHFVSKLSDAESEAEETRVWLEIAHRCGYISDVQAKKLDEQFDRIIAQLVTMSTNPDQWIIREKTER
jgi:four helix bundle protein